MRSILRFVPLFLLFAFILSACSTSKDVATTRRIQKRKYTQGYYLAKAHNKRPKKAKVEIPEQEEALARRESVDLKEDATSSTRAEKSSTKNTQKKRQHSKLQKGDENEHFATQTRSRNPKDRVAAKLNKGRNLALKKVRENHAELKTHSVSRPGRADGLGIAAFICGIVGLFVFGLVLGILSLIFGIVSMGRYRDDPQRPGKGFPIVAIILGIIDIIGALIFISMVV